MHSSPTSAQPMSQSALIQEIKQPRSFRNIKLDIGGRGIFSWYSQDVNDECKEGDYENESYDNEYDRTYDDREDREFYDDNDSDEMYDQYDDFSVSPKPLPRAPSAITARLSRPHAHSISTTVPVLPAEILHLIFSYSDHTTLCLSISRVSRQFNAISKHYIHRELVGRCLYLTEEEEETLLEQLRSGSINVLRVSCPIDWMSHTGRLPPLDTWYGAWTRFAKIITEPIYAKKNLSPEACHSSNDHLADSTDGISGVRDPRRHCLLDSIRKLQLGDPAVPALLPYLHRVRILEISDENWRCYRNFYLHPLLESCTSLDILKMDGFRKDYDRLLICWSQDAIEAQTFSRLTYFSIYHGMSMSADTVKAILDACPFLSYFKLWKVHIIDNHRNPSFWTTPPIAPMYRHAARLRPNLQLFMIIPRQASNSDAMAHHLALTAELFPRIRHLEIEATLPENWCPDALVSNFLSQITSIDIFSDISPGEVNANTISRSSRDMDLLLKHCRKLIRLNAGKVKYTRSTPPSLSSLHQFPSHSGAYAWRRRQLRVLDLGLYDLTENEDEDMFRFLVHACPNLTELSLNLRSSTWRIGQEERIVSTSQEVRSAARTVTRRHKPPSTHVETWTEEVKTEVWQECKNTFLILGQLSRLERLEVRLGQLPEVLYPSNFEFLRVTSHKNRGRDGLADMPVFCPRLQMLRIRFWRWDVFGKMRGEPLTEQQFVKELKKIRPKVAISFR